MTASASSIIASWVDDVTQWPLVTDEGSTSASSEITCGSREKRDKVYISIVFAYCLVDS